MNLATFEMPTSVTTIGDSAFRYDAKLKTFPTSTNPNPGNGVLNLASTSLSSVGQYAFSGCSLLANVSFPNTTTAIPKGCFQGDSILSSFTFGAQTTTINAFAFKGTALTTATIPDSVTLIDQEAYSGVSALTTLHLPANLTKIGTSAFSGASNLTSVNYSSALTSGSVEFTAGAFYGCTSLPSLVIPKYALMSYSGTKVFQGCTTLAAATGNNGTTSGLFLDMNETYYLSVASVNFAQTWNFSTSSGSAIAFGLHAESVSDVVTGGAHVQGTKYWHYVNGVPTFWTPA